MVSSYLVPKTPIPNSFECISLWSYQHYLSVKLRREAFSDAFLCSRELPAVTFDATTLLKFPWVFLFFASSAFSVNGKLVRNALVSGKLAGLVDDRVKRWSWNSRIARAETVATGLASVVRVKILITFYQRSSIYSESKGRKTRKVWSLYFVSKIKYIYFLKSTSFKWGLSLICLITCNNLFDFSRSS